MIKVRVEVLRDSSLISAATSSRGIKTLCPSLQCKVEPAIKIPEQALGRSSVIESLTSVHETLGSVPITEKKTKTLSSWVLSSCNRFHLFPQKKQLIFRTNIGPVSIQKLILISEVFLSAAASRSVIYLTVYSFVFTVYFNVSPRSHAS